MDNTASHGHTRGGQAGHLSRRLIHIAMLLIPIAYYYWGESLARQLSMPAPALVLVVLLLVLIFEFVRLHFKLVVFAQRQHEALHISSFAWGAIAVAIVLIVLPQPIFAIPVVTACAIVDPLIGELRLRHYAPWLVALIGFAMTLLIWLLADVWLPMPWWLPFVLAVVTVAAEWPNFKWIDDTS